MKKLIIALASSLLFAQTTTVDLKLTNSTIAGYVESGIVQENFKIRGMYLYNDNDGKNNFYLAGIKAEGNFIGTCCNEMKFSIITDFVHTKNNSAVALGIGGFSFIPGIEFPIFVRGEVEYAPKVLSFDDADRFSRVSVELGYAPITNAEIFIGYRNISFNHNYNSAGYFGLGYNF